MSRCHRNPLLLLSVFFSLSFSLNEEGLILLQFKSGLDDPRGAISDWNPSSATPCNWTGVSCTAGGAVAAVNLDYLDLAGQFGPLLCSLPHLSNLSLSYNYINSTLPGGAALSRCSALTFLDLSTNNLVGPLPAALASLPNLRRLNLDSNNFSGEIPPAFAGFPVLESLSIVYNLLGGTIPSFLANISTLQELRLAYNPFSPGIIPPAIGNLSELRSLWLTDCNLVGGIPSSLGNLRLLENLDLAMNNLDGPIPDTLTELSNVVQIELYKNSLTGHIPEGLGKLKFLRFFDASVNLLEGTIPASFFNLPLLESFHVYQNRLAGELPASIAGAGSLSDLRLHGNRLNGTLPPDLGANSRLVVAELSQNRFSGEIPKSICNGSSLQQLMLIGNFFTGPLPEVLGQCKTLLRVRLRDNLLTGKVPAAMWGLPHLSLLDLAGNSFSGEISASISGARNLSSLVISRNQFSGGIPVEMASLPKLFELSASDNRLTGQLPPAIGKLTGLQLLDLHNNNIFGEIPRDILSWQQLTELNLASNSFTGSIPPELGELPVLNYLDLSNNLLSGAIPPELQNLKLSSLNLSNNKLSGGVPPLFASGTFKDSFLGNPDLCRELSGLCAASPPAAAEKRLYIIFSVLAVAVLILLIGLARFYFTHWRFVKLGWGRRSSRSSWKLTSFHKVSFPEQEIVDALEEQNLIGAGASGDVYRVVLSDGTAVAVKKLQRTGAGEEGSSAPEKKNATFEAEVETLGRVRHKNIVRLWCCCVLDDCKLLVYEYLPNGSLGDVLHGDKAKRLDWRARKKIAVDVAEGLAYLHHHCVPPVIHRDIKSSNILLDGDLSAKIGDFGVAKAADPAKSMTVVAGSLGYIAPEYAYTLKVSEKSDVYSFGVVLLELVTGRHPLDGELGGKDLVRWVLSAVEEKGPTAVMDSSLRDEFEEERRRMLELALLCASSFPMNRPAMSKVVKVLLDGGGSSGDGGLAETDGDEGKAS